MSRKMSMVPIAGVLMLVPLTIGGCRSASRVTPEDPLPLGAPCVIDGDCTAGLECWQSELIGDPWCTRACAVDEDCPLGARCADVEPNLEGEGYIRMCAPSCTREAGTRGGCPLGMSCEGDGVCEPNACEIDAECGAGRTCEESSGRCLSGGNPDATADGPCLEDADCRAPNGVCLSDECYHLECDLGGAYECLPGEVCYAYLPGDAMTPSYRCKRACEPGVDATSPTEPGACELGEICTPPEAAIGAPALSGWCETPLGGEFLAGDPSARIGDPCTSVADCPYRFGYGWCSRGHCAMDNCAASVFAGADPCGPSAICIHDDVAPDGWTLDQIAYLRAGFCGRTCSDTEPCPTGLTCSSSTGTCL